MDLPLPRVDRYGGTGWAGLSSVDRVPLLGRKGSDCYRRPRHTMDEEFAGRH